jgi:GNAT superfamily N-acetyltransferase
MAKKAEAIDLRLRFELTHTAATREWSDEPGIDSWFAELSVYNVNLRYGAPTTVIGRVSMYCVDLSQCHDIYYSLDCMDADLGALGWTVSRLLAGELPRFDTWCARRVLLVQDVVLDPRWRGRGIGPALVAVSAQAIGDLDGVFLTPAAVPTRRDASGAWHSDYSGKRPPPEATAKVIRAWRRAGFRSCGDGVYFWDTSDDVGQDRARKAQALISRVELSKDDIAWWRRRTAKIVVPT